MAGDPVELNKWWEGQCFRYNNGRRHSSSSWSRSSYTVNSLRPVHPPTSSQRQDVPRELHCYPMCSSSDSWKRSRAPTVHGWSFSSQRFNQCGANSWTIGSYLSSNEIPLLSALHDQLLLARWYPARDLPTENRESSHDSHTSPDSLSPDGCQRSTERRVRKQSPGVGVNYPSTYHTNQVATCLHYLLSNTPSNAIGSIQSTRLSAREGEAHLHLPGGCHRETPALLCPSCRWQHWHLHLQIGSCHEVAWTHMHVFCSHARVGSILHRMSASSPRIHLTRSASPACG